MDRPQPQSLFPANLFLIGATVLGLLLAIVLGAILGESQFTPLLLICLGIGGVLFAVSLYRYVWQMALFLLFFGFSYRPTSFGFGSLELGCALGVAVISLFVWQKRNSDRPAVLDDFSLPFLQRVLFAWLLYVALHAVYNIASPFRPTEFALNNSIKSYFAVSAPLLLFFYFSRTPAGLVVRKDFFWTISKLCLFGLFINIGVRFYELAIGRYLYIPLIGATSGLYALRTLGPLAMTIGSVGLTAQAGHKTPVRFATYWTLLLGGGLGAAFSGGRYALLIGFASVCGVLVLRRKVVALFVVLVIGIIGAAVANLSSDWINTKADPIVQRSLQWVLLHKKAETISNIENSTDWRRELFHRAIDEWQSDPRIFWTGRATYGFGVADETAILIAGGYEALIRTALRRGVTHNLISDLLVTYGVIGCVLYLLVFCSIIRFLWKAHRSRRLSSPAANLALVSFVASGVHLVYSIIGGNYYPPELVWFLVILLASVYSGAGIEERPKLALRREKIDPQPVRRPRPVSVGQRPLLQARD